MRVYIHDFAGHPFQIELSRSLAERGHTISHVYAGQFDTGRGRMDSSDRLTVTALETQTPFVKYGFVGRLRFEMAYVRRLIEDIRNSDPELVVLCNTPLVVVSLVSRALRRMRKPWILWHQDVFSDLMGKEILSRLPGPLGAAGARLFRTLETRQVNGATAVVPIGSGFVRRYEDWGARPQRLEVIPNWAPISDLPTADRENRWAASVGIPTDAVRLVYSGTLGKKHNPGLLLSIVKKLREWNHPVHLTIVSQTESLQAIAPHCKDLPVTLLPFQPMADLPLVLGSADVLLTLLELDASEFSIPSKVLTYLCAGRPVIGLMPAANPAAADIQRAGGAVFTPDDHGALSAAAWIHDVASSGNLRSLGAESRRYAEEAFNIGEITSRFESLFKEVCRGDDQGARLADVR